MIVWERSRRIPRWVQAALSALQFAGRSRVPDLSDTEWRQLLDFTDRCQATLVLDSAAKGFPAWAADRIARDREKNAERVTRAFRAYDELAAGFRLAGMEFATLKGFTQWPDYLAELRLRVQYDLDLFCPA